MNIFVIEAERMKGWQPVALTFTREQATKEIKELEGTERYVINYRIKECRLVEVF